MTLKQQTFTAIRWTTIAMIGKAVFQFGQTVILARMLTSSDFGLMSMVLAVIAYIQVFTDLGVSNAIIHHQNISINQLSSLYWLNVLVGIFLTLTLMASSYGISVFIFRQPSLQPVLSLVGFSILITAIGQQLRVMAEKSMRFSILAKIELIAALFGFTAAIGWAWRSPDVYALVSGLLVNGLMQTLLLWSFATEGWRPKLRLRLGEIRQFLKFGGYMMANNFINSFNSQVDVLIAGRMFPVATLGFYSLPRNFSLTIAGTINPIVTRVGLPVMAKAQNDKDLLKTVYLKTMRMTASINFPIYIALALFSEEIVFVIFGVNWIDSAPLLKYLAIWGMFRSCGNPVGSLLLAVGKAKLSFGWNIGLFFIVPPTLYAASFWGISGLAMAQAMLMVVLLIPGWYFLVRPNCGVRGLEYGQALLSPLITALLSVELGCLAVSTLTHPLWRLSGAALVAVPLYLGLSYLLNKGWLLSIRQLIIKS